MDKISQKVVLLTGSILCFLAIAIGAFGAHALSAVLEQNDRVDTFLLANRYQFYHGLGLLFLGNRYNFSFQLEKLMVVALFFGVLLFSGSLYTLAISNVGWLGAVAPVGGVLMLTGWAILAVLIARGR